MERLRTSVLLLFVLVFAGQFTACTNSNDKTPIARMGVIDLNGYDFAKNGPAALSGEWEFYWKNYLVAEDFKKPALVKNRSYITIPGGWHKYFSDASNLPGKGYATFRLIVYTKDNPGKLALDISKVESAYAVYVDGIKMGSAGRIESKYRPEIAVHRPHNIMKFLPGNGRTEIVVHVSNYHMTYGGIWDPIYMGHSDNIERMRNIDQNIAAIIFGGFIIIGIYNLVLFIIKKTDRTYLCFAMLSIVGAVWVLISQHYLITVMFPSLTWEMIAKIEYINLIIALILFGWFFKVQFEEEFSTYPMRIMEILGAVLILIILVTGIDSYMLLVQIYGLAAAVFILYVLWMTVRAVIRKKKYAGMLLTVSIIFLFTLINDIARRNGIIIFDQYLSIYGLVIFILADAYIISKRFFVSFQDEKSIARDIKIMNDGLERTESDLNTIFNSISSMLVLSDGQGCITRSNFAARTLFPDLSEGNRQMIWDIKPFSDMLRKGIKDAFMSQSFFEADDVTFADSGERFYSVFLRPFVYENERGGILKIDDVTGIKEKNRQFRNAERMEEIGIIAGGLAHDFNNILTGITGTISLISNSHLRDEEYISKTSDRLDLIEQSVGRAVNLVNRIMTLAKRQDFTCTGIDLNTVLDSVAQFCRNTFDDAIEVVTERYPEPAYIYADATQIEEVMINLSINAYHAMTIMRKSGEKPGGTLRIRISRIDPDSGVLAPYPVLVGSYCWAVDVSDTGVGIDEDSMKRIFEPFFSTKEVGTGLGLVMVSNIIQQHGGFIEVKSVKHKGTDFRIILPVYYPRAKDEAVHVREELPKGEGLILLAEDDGILKKSTGDILGLWGYKVTVADDGIEAIRFFGKRHAGIKGVIMNLSIPRMSGRELYSEIKKIDPGMKVIVISSVKPGPEMIDVLKMEGDGFIEIPYSMNELLGKCRDVFSSGESR